MALHGRHFGERVCEERSNLRRLVVHDVDLRPPSQPRLQHATSHVEKMTPCARLEGLRLKPDLSDDSVERVDQHEVEERLRLWMQTDLHQLVRLVRVRLDAEARQVAVDHELHVRMTRVRTSRAQAGLTKQHVLKKEKSTCTYMEL